MGSERDCVPGIVRLGASAAAATALVAAAVAGGGAQAAALPGAAAHAARGSAAQAGIISTVAGGVGGPALGAKVAIGNPCGLSPAASRLYIAGSNAVRALSARTGRLTTVTGTGVSGPLPVGGPAAGASVSGCGVTVDHSGNLVIADYARTQNRILVVAHASGTFYGQLMKAGHIYSVAGRGGKGGFSGDGGLAVKARLDEPWGVAVDSAGNLVFADRLNSVIRVVAEKSGTFYGMAMEAGDIYTVAGNGADGCGSGGNGGPAVKAILCFPAGVAVDSSGNLVIADSYNDQIRVVAASTGTFYGKPMKAGHIYAVAGNGHIGFSGDGGPATKARFWDPEGVALDSAGNVVIADTLNGRIRVVAEKSGTFYGMAMEAGDIYTVAGGGTGGLGDGGPATAAELSYTQDVAVDGAGNLVITDTGFHRIRVVAASSGTSYGVAMKAGDIYTVAGNGADSFSGDGAPATRARLFHPRGLTVDGAGNLVFADTLNNRVRLVAHSSGTFYGQAMKAGDIYTVAGDGQRGFSGGGGPATAAELNRPFGVAVDSAGNVVIADTSNQRIRVVAAGTGTFYGRAMKAGHIYTVAGDQDHAGFSGDGGPATAAELAGPRGVAVDGAGNLVIADTGNERIRVVAASTGTFYGQAMKAGDTYTVAGDGTAGFSGDGGPAIAAELKIPEDVAVDGAGNLVIADTWNQRIRVVAGNTGTFYGRPMTAGHIYTVAGDGTEGFSGDGGPAIAAKLKAPQGVAVDVAGNLLIADSLNHRVRVVAESSGTFYGVAMKAGDIYTVAGNGTDSFTGDGGPATSAGLSALGGVAAGGAGSLLISDTAHDRIRQVTG